MKLYWEIVDTYYSKIQKHERIESNIIDMNQLLDNLLVSLHLVSTNTTLSLELYEFYSNAITNNPFVYMMIDVEVNDNGVPINVKLFDNINEIIAHKNNYLDDIDNKVIVIKENNREVKCDIYQYYL
jgi:hypothetical protein